MEILDLANHYNLIPKYVAATNGGEYHSPCPSCGGKDRFMIWPKKDRYFCRRCNIRGDSLQFCKDYMGLSYKEALDHIGNHRNLKNSSSSFVDDTSNLIDRKAWLKAAEKFCEEAHHNLLQDQEGINFIKRKYGLEIDAIRLYQVGWNPIKIFFPKSEWGIGGSKKKLCLPKGPVFACRHKGEIFKLKIRNCEWKEGDLYGKYREIEGSSNRTAIFGYLTNQTIIVVESELDAMLLVQEIGEFCTCIALGGATKKPDSDTAAWLKTKYLILYSLDFDAAGKEQYAYWRSIYPNLRAWPSETRKSPADSFVLDGIDLKKWFEEGIKHWGK
jgi:DNA primase